ncbi:hypothetical protein FQN54_008025 [Arachnomyces sp. PD_36]|nr:hypothetical protein FQN54_008025 [Arachnomyces sp. PD_36]
MSRNITRGFQSTARTLIQFAGAGLQDIAVSNGPAGNIWEGMTKRVCDAIEKADPRIKVANVQGALAHRSSKDRNDKQDVITVGLTTSAGTRVGSVHVHLDGSFKFFPSRAGRDGGYDKNILRASIEGHINEIEKASTEEPSSSGKGPTTGPK